MKKILNRRLGARGCLLAVVLMANVVRAYDSPDNRVPSPTYRSTNLAPVVYTTPSGQYALNSFFDIFTDTQRFPPPAPGTNRIDSFFDVFTEISLEGPGIPKMSSTDATCAPSLHWKSGPVPSPLVIDTEMLQLDMSGGQLPQNVLIRESPTLASTGKTTITDLSSGLYRIDSFFDVFTELSIDGGQSWWPGNGPLHIDGGIPEPSSAMLMLLGAIGYCRFGLRRGR